MSKPLFHDVSGAAAAGKVDLWEPIIVTREEIDSEVERLAAQPRPANGRRESVIVHPRSTAGGFLPGVRVTLSVLKPGERTTPLRQNATQVNFCIRGTGRAEIGDTGIAYGRFDVWNTPSFRPYAHVNDGKDLQVRLTYSNAPLLEMLNVHFVEDDPPAAASATTHDAGPDDPRRRNPYGIVTLDNGSKLMPYEILINPETVESRALHWPWAQVKAHLDKLEALGKDYIGRRLYMMYNPMTGRTNGCTPSFFATITIRPPKIVDRPHRHSSAAINYYFRGRGRSTVEGTVYEWKAGDLMLSAPGWGVHNHASHDEPVYELTVQDQPLHIYMESLLWQEDLKHPAALLGSQPGFSTNRRAVG
ncbi:MAG TPA: AraC family ligand binding domain-containing protein [Hyphomicrobiales bacterium]|nr:AraC family ligand binding domain-containing protein [Hyphomicrobiales bacterium]